MSKLNLTTAPAGAVVADLLRRIAAYQQPDGSIPGSDTVMVIGEWLADLGLDWDRIRVGKLALLAQSTVPAPALPSIDFDEAKARAWLTAPSPHSIDGETNAEDAGVLGDWDPESDDGDFLAVVDRLVVGADEAALFGDQVSLLAYITAGTDLIADGALITITGPRPAAAPALRLSSPYLDHGDLQWNRDDRGLDAALGILRSVAHHARTSVHDAAGFLDEQRRRSREPA